MISSYGRVCGYVNALVDVKHIDPFTMILLDEPPISEIPLGIDEFIDIVKNNIHIKGNSDVKEKFEKIFQYIFDDCDINTVLSMYYKEIIKGNCHRYNDKSGNQKYFDLIHINLEFGHINKWIHYESYYKPKEIPIKFLTLIKKEIGYPKLYEYNSKNSLEFFIFYLYYFKNVEYEKIINYLNKARKICQYINDDDIESIFSEIYQSNLVLTSNHCKENKIASYRCPLCYLGFIYSKSEYYFKIKIRKQYGVLEQNEESLIKLCDQCGTDLDLEDRLIEHNSSD